MTSAEFKEKYYPSIPDEPGVYRFIDEDGIILYVGKAKNLRKRVNSYFLANPSIHKVKYLVKNSSTIEYTIVHNEHDALLLENTLIKRFQPRYNVMLKDGKSYSYIRIRKENYPRVEFVRRVIRDGSLYFGPYTSKYKANQLVELIKQLFPIRTCNLNLTEKNISAGKFKVCLQYHIKQCLGPCENLQSEQDYNDMIQQIKNILRGHFREVKDFIHEKMHFYAEKLQFELAQEYKDKLIIFEDYQAKSTVVSPNITDLDVFYIDEEAETAFVNYLKIVNGAIIAAETVKMIKNLDDDIENLLVHAILNFRDKYSSIAPEIVVPFKINTDLQDVKVTIPKIGDKHSLLEMSMKNVKYFMIQIKMQNENPKKLSHSERILNTLKNDLNLNVVPEHIECFDNSNLQGTNPVASCVVFKNARPSKKDYRHFNVKSVEGPNDFASMEEIVFRRYGRLIREEQSLPQLIIIDGGKGQLSSAMKSIELLGLKDKVAVIGIAKKLEEIFYPNDSIPLYINKKSESLKLIQQLRNEAHRFAITFHRNQRSKNFITSELQKIKGVGEKSVKKLLSTYKSIDVIRSTSVDDLSSVVGKSIAQSLKDYFDEV